MSISSAIQSAITGINTNKEQIEVISNNIANVNTEGYVKRSVQQKSQSTLGVGQGVIIEDIRRDVDVFLVERIANQQTALGESEVLAEYYQRIQLLYGQPNQNNSLNNYVDDFFESLNSLSTNPELPSLRTDVVDQGVALTEYISGLADNLYDLQLSADTEFNNVIENINNDIAEIYNLNQNIAESLNNDLTPNDLLEERELLIKDLAKKININVYQGEDLADITIMTSRGIALLDENQYELQYNNAVGPQTFIDDTGLSNVTVVALRDDGTQIGQSIELVSAGVNSGINNIIDNGEFRAYTDLRDNLIPDLIDQLDLLSTQIADSVNEVHNKGSGYPALNSITGTTLISADESRDLSGEVRIGLVDSVGKPIDSPYTSEDAFGMRPLTIDLAALDSGNGPGTPTMQSIINEINYYYGAPQPQVSIGNISDVKLVTTQGDITTAGSVTFDLELDSLSAYDSGIVINNFTVVDGAAVAQTVVSPGALPTTEFTHNAGERSRTGSNTNFEFTGTGTLPYTVTLEIQVDDGLRNADSIQTGTISFVVDEAFAGQDLQNIRHNPSPTVLGDAEYTAPSGNDALLVAEIVDTNGNVVSGASDEGVLRLRAVDSSYGIVIDELDSQDNGLSTDTSITATNQGFSSYFGLNDFFVTNDTVANSAYNMQVRSDIIANPSVISTSSYTQAADLGIDGTVNYTYEISIGNNEVISQLSDVKDQLYSFSATGGLSASTVTLSTYSTSIISFVGSETLKAERSLQQEDLVAGLLDDEFSSKSGVNLDEELANTVIYQNSYTAAARIITVADEMLETLLNAV